MNNYKTLLLAVLLIFPQFTQAGWSDYVDDFKDTVKEKTAARKVSSLSEDVIVKGLKQALNQGVEKSIKQLGQKDGFLKDPSIKIAMPGSLKKLERGLKRIGHGEVANKFVNTMNHAAEEAVPGTMNILVQAVKEMTLQDAAKILKGEHDAATQYFKQRSLSHLRVVIKPVVQKATNLVGITDAYKTMVSKAGFLAKYIDKDSLDIDQYITNKTIDGLFSKIALEEMRIRKDPLARTTDILKQVFVDK